MSQRERVEQEVAALRLVLGTGPYAVVRTAFHGGGGLGRRHRSLRAAVSRALAHRSADCACGCAVVIDASALDALPLAVDATSAYAAAR